MMMVDSKAKKSGTGSLDAKFGEIRDFVKEAESEVSKPGFNSFGLGDCKAPKVLGDIIESIAAKSLAAAGAEILALKPPLHVYLHLWNLAATNMPDSRIQKEEAVITTWDNIKNAKVEHQSGNWRSPIDVVYVYTYLIDCLSMEAEKKIRVN
ncbi:hypothetical protein SSX86_016205 [Deinandra increscens subsp. villosa]|uniref:Uncharacterized protein n=1 Tax=Deinandra increscens subsp. villosa TaxID=3103831 RepID=A0AAP0D509_9ASTR